MILGTCFALCFVAGWLVARLEVALYTLRQYGKRYKPSSFRDTNLHKSDTAAFATKLDR